MTARRPIGGVGRMILALVASLCLVLVLAGCAQSSASTAAVSAPAASTATVSPSATPSPTRPATDPTSGLPTIALADLPPEARETLARIDRGGPFPYDQDGVVFQNREGLLPRQGSGYYREYTVVTPGSPDRGPRRIVTGGGGERYYTADHYTSFERIWP